MLKTKEQKIDGTVVLVTQYPARRGFKLQLKLIHLFGPSIGEILGGIKKGVKVDNISKTDVDLSKLGPAIGMLFDKIDEDEMIDLLLTILESTRLDSKEITAEIFDTEFAGEYGKLFTIVGFVLQFNFKSLFGKGGIGKIMAKLMKDQPTIPPVN